MSVSKRPHKRLSWTYVGLLGALFTIVSCEQLSLTAPPTPAPRAPTPGYPDIRAMIDQTLDAALASADNASARSSATDPGYATLRSVLTRARDANLTTARALNLDRGSLVQLTDKERHELQALIDSDPALRGEIEALTAKLKAEYAALSPIKVKVQPVDEQHRPAGDPYTITSKDGVVELGYITLTSSRHIRVGVEKE